MTTRGCPTPGCSGPHATNAQGLCAMCILSTIEEPDRPRVDLVTPLSLMAMFALFIYAVFRWLM